MSAAEAPEGVVPPADKDPKSTGTDRWLRRILILMVEATVVLAIVFGVIYYVGQRTTAGPTLNDRAISQAEEAVRSDPNSLGARLGLAAAYHDAGRDDDALSQYLEVEKADPANRAAKMGAGAIYYARGELLKALEEYQAAVKLTGDGEFAAADPQLQESLYYVGRISLEKGDMPAAKDALKKALVIDKTDSDAWYLLGDAQVRSGEEKQAADSYAQALVFVPWGWCDPYTGLQAAYTKLGESDGVAYAKAMSEICEGRAGEGVAALKAITKGKFQVPALIGLGLAAEAAGNQAEAREWYLKVVQVEPKNVAALTALERLDPAANTAGSESGSESASQGPSASPS